MDLEQLGDNPLGTCGRNYSHLSMPVPKLTGLPEVGKPTLQVGSAIP